LQNALPRYGTYVRVSTDELAQIVKSENEYVYVVVHLYQNHIEACARTNVAIEQLAPQFPYVHFVRIRSTEAMPNYSDLGLPTLLIYKGTKLVESLIRITDAIGKNIDATSVGRLLHSHHVLRMPTGEEAGNKESASKTKRNK